MRAVNLLPPEQALQARRRRNLAFGLLLGVAFVALLAVATVFRLGQAADAEQAVEDQRAINMSIQAQIDGLSEAAQTKRQFDESAAQIQEALAVDVEWGRLLNDVGRVIPDSVWVTSMSATRSVPDDGDDEPVTYGSVEIEGRAFDYPDASTWLRTLDSPEWEAVGGAWVGSISQEEVANLEIVSFSSAAVLTGGSLSSRAEERVPVVAE